MSVKILVGDVRAMLATLPDESVNCIWTSVPYWGLRSYGTVPQVWGGDPICVHIWGAQQRNGKRADLKPSSETLSVGRIRVDSRQGTSVLDGGRFCSVCGAWSGEHGLEPSLDRWLLNEVVVWQDLRRILRADGVAWLNVGDAYATSSNGRSAADTKAAGNDDRTFRDEPFDTGKASGLKSKQRLMLPARLALALQADGWWLRDEIVWSKPNPMPSSIKDRTTPAHEMLYLLTRSPRYAFDHAAFAEAAVSDHASGNGFAGRQGGSERCSAQSGGGGTVAEWNDIGGMRNRRSVWSINTEPFAGAHFATAPSDLVKPCILAGCPTGGMVLDPFGGAGTTGLVADRLGRNAILIELNPEYAEIARARIKADAGLFSDVA